MLQNGLEKTEKNMKQFKIKTDNFLELLEPLSSVIKSSHRITILQCVKIEIYKGKLYITGDNSEINCVNKLKIQSDIKVSFCVNYLMLLSIIKSIKNQIIKFNVDNKNLSIVHTKGNFKIPLDAIREFPLLQLEKFTNSVTVEGKQFKSALRVANKFILNSDLDPTSNISIEVGKIIKIRSTNKACLFEEKISGKGAKAMLLINGKSSTAIGGLFEDEEIEMNYNENKIFFKFPTREIMVVQQHGDFPVVQFNKILESINESKPLIVNYENFLTSLKRTSILSDKKDNTVMIDINKSELKFICNNREISGRAKESIKAKFKKPRIVSYNSKLLIEILGVFDGKGTEFFINEMGAFCIKQKKKKGLVGPLMNQDI